MSAKRKIIDIELERARRAFDSPEAFPGEALEAVIYGLQNDVAAADYETVEGRKELRTLCERIIARIEQRERL